MNYLSCMEFSVQNEFISELINPQDSELKQRVAC